MSACHLEPTKLSEMSPVRVDHSPTPTLPVPWLQRRSGYGPASHGRAPAAPGHALGARSCRGCRQE
jgi:hypothetical protein